MRRFGVVLSVWALGLAGVLGAVLPVGAATAMAVATAGGFTSLAPARLLDTRTGVGAAKVAVAAGGTVHLLVTGRGGVPASGVSAVVLNVTVTAPTSAGYITVYADGKARPTASNLNFVKGQTVPNLVIAPVGANGKVALFNGSGGTVQLIGDVSGYYRAPAQSWSAPTTLAPGGITKALSCSDAATCTAVDGSGNAITYNGSTWARPQIIDAHHSFVGLSCPTTSFCTAVDASGYALNDVGGHWSAPVALNTVVPNEGLSGVSCASSTFCMATSSLGKVYRFNGLTWSAPITVIPDAAISGISCPSAAFCMMGDTAGRVTRFNGSTWSVPVTIDPGLGLRSMSCPTSSFCAVTDDFGNVLTWHGSSWSAPVALGFGADVSCTSASSCLAVGSDGSVSGLQSRYNGSTWTTVTPGAPTLMTLVSCVSTVCVTVAPAFSGINSTSSTFNGTGWSSPVIVEQDRTLVDASCASSNFCAAIDGTGDAYIYNGTAWAAGVKIDSAAAPTSISCTSASFCMVVDDGGGAVRYSGAAWSARMIVGGSINTLSCASSTFCVATIGKTVSTWNGSAWGAAKASGAPGTNILSVSCTGTQICTAVDSSGYSLDDTPTGWTAPHQVTPDWNGLTSVSCVSQGFCATVGGAGGFVRKNGTWGPAPLPVNTGLGSPSTAGHQISCVSTDYCLSPGTSDTGIPAIASYDGQAWAIARTFGDPGYRFPLAPLTVSCALDQSCLINLREVGNGIVAWGRFT